MTCFIAEIGSNHNGSRERLAELIKLSADAGFWGVKLQLFEPGGVYADIPANRKVREIVKCRALPKELVMEAEILCESQSLMFGASIFSESVLAENENIDFDFLKISSFDILRLDLIKKCAQKSGIFHLMISTGMATLGEISTARIAANHALKGKEIVIMHCVSQYPSPPWAASLDKIAVYRKQFPENSVGYSDHTVSTGVIFQAVNQEASFIELHVDLDDAQGAESMHGHCWPMAKTRVLLNELSNANGALQSNFVDYSMRDQRADPVDGLRPMRKARCK